MQHAPVLVALIATATVLACAGGPAPETPRATTPTEASAHPAAEAGAEEEAEEEEEEEEEAEAEEEVVEGDGLAVPEDLRARVASALPDARFTAYDGSEHGDVATLVKGSLRLRFAYRWSEPRVDVSLRGALDATRLVLALAEAGVELSRTTRWLFTSEGVALHCEEDPASYGRQARCHTVPESEVGDAVTTATGGVPEWLRPPRRRRGRAQPPVSDPSTWPVASGPAVDRVRDAVGRSLELSITGARLSDTHRLILVRDKQVSYTDGLLACLIRTTPRASAGEDAGPDIDCAPSELGRLEGVVASLPEGWLIAGTQMGGSHRDTLRYLVAATHTDAGLTIDAIDMGGVGSEGEACQRHPGYCVFQQASLFSARVVAPNCVERRPVDGWTATHVRVQQRWVGLTVERVTPCVERFQIREGLFEPSTCGPAHEEPTCGVP